MRSWDIESLLLAHRYPPCRIRLLRPPWPISQRLDLWPCRDHTILPRNRRRCTCPARSNFDQRVIVASNEVKEKNLLFRWTWGERRQFGLTLLRDLEIQELTSPFRWSWWSAIRGVAPMSGTGGNHLEVKFKYTMSYRSMDGVLTETRVSLVTFDRQWKLKSEGQCHVIYAFCFTCKSRCFSQFLSSRSFPQLEFGVSDQ